MSSNHGFRTAFSKRFIVIRQWRGSVLSSCGAGWCLRTTVHQPYQLQCTAKSFHAVVAKRLSTTTHDALKCFKDSYKVPRPTIDIKCLSSKLIGDTVILQGYLGSRSDISKSLSFVPVVDQHLAHSVQIISSSVENESKDGTAHERLRTLRQHVPVIAKGIVQSKIKPKSSSGISDIARIEDVEIKLLDIYALNNFETNVDVKDKSSISPKHRYLQLRFDTPLRKALEFRSKLAQACRGFLENAQGFLEIETPLLFKSTAEGAREFLVPTRTSGEAFALPQSPQQYKQVLMASGIPKYFQLARCFRDEDLRADRQPEFTQIDLEMAFASSSDVMTCIESLMRHLWQGLLNIKLEEEEFPVLTYQEAMAMYGSDKPDTRLGMQIMRIEELIPFDLVGKLSSLSDPIVECFKLSTEATPTEVRSCINEFMSSVEARALIDDEAGQPGVFIYDSRKPIGGLQAFGFESAQTLERLLQLSEGDVMIVQARKRKDFSGGSTPLGLMRTALHKFAAHKGLVQKPEGWNFLWITEFPLFTPSDGITANGTRLDGVVSTHHPFTAPLTPDDIDLLQSNPISAKADHYDLVLNGIELGGGSRRIHDAQVQKYVFRNVLQLDDQSVNQFSYLLNALEAGCPPHAGIALGFDRLCTEMLQKETIRDVIAFPKNGRGTDMMVGSPARVNREQLEQYHLRLLE